MVTHAQPIAGTSLIAYVSPTNEGCLSGFFFPQKLSQMLGYLGKRTQIRGLLRCVV